MAGSAHPQLHRPLTPHRLREMLKDGSFPDSGLHGY
jgi:hypothetical protein